MTDRVIHFLMPAVLFCIAFVSSDGMLEQVMLLFRPNSIEKKYFKKVECLLNPEVLQFPSPKTSG